jgi:hypothetical protein
VTANPTHTSVQWQKLVNNQYQTIAFNNNNNKYSGSTVNTPSLTLSSSDLNDEGYYICTAANSLGNISFKSSDSLIGGQNLSTLRKPQTRRKSL